MAEKSTKQFFISPLGTVAPYCWIQKADTKFKAQGEYKVNLIVGEKAAAKLVNKITDMHDANFAAAKKDPKFKGKRIIEAELPFSVCEDSGDVTFRFKMNASYLDKASQEQKPLICRLVDSKGERIPKAPAIGTGSEIKVRFSLLPFAAVGGIGAGIKLQMDSIMLVKLVEFSQGGASGKDDNWGGEEEEGGFTKEAADNFNDDDQDESADAGSDDGDY